MGLDPLTLGLVTGGLSAASTLASGLAQSSQQKMQAKAQEAQADQLRQQARLQAQQGQVELEANDRQKAQLRRQYAAQSAANAVALGSGNVDLSSGSALQAAEGSASLFANDIGENAYTRALKDWQTQNQVKATNYQADTLDAQASYASRTANNLAPTIIGAGLSGLSGFMSGFSHGGKFGSTTTAKPKYWDRALQDWSATLPRH